MPLPRWIIAALVGSCTACGAPAGKDPGEATMAETIRVESTAFANGEMIPPKYSMDGGNLSPPLSWSAGPKGTKTYALIVDDPDAPAGTWVHWLVWNIPGTRLDEGAGAASRSPGAMTQGTNSWKRTGWGGPQPPSGTHRYYFRIYALDTELNLESNADRAKLDSAMRGHQLASGELMGRFSAAK